MFGLLKLPSVMAGMLVIFMVFTGLVSFFTYILPVYMTLAGFDVGGLTFVLLSFGIARFIGTSLSAVFLKRSLKYMLTLALFIIALSALSSILWGSDQRVAGVVAIVWGFSFAIIPVRWSTWITRSLAEQTKKVGSIQVANTSGAAIGGLVLDSIELLAPLILSCTLMLLTAILVALTVSA